MSTARLIWQKTIGMRLAEFLDRHTDWCWAILCTNIGFGYRPFGWREARDSAPKCKAECSGPIEGCYCGKFMSERLRKELESRNAE